MLARRYGLFNFDMGEELTRRRQNDLTFDAEMQRTIDRGNLALTRIVRQILRETIVAVPPEQGILFNGHPKMLGEAKLAATLLRRHQRPAPLVLYLAVPLEVTVARMRKRKGYASGKFGKRADDTDQALRNRVRYYRHNIAQVVTFFGMHFPYTKINGAGSKAEVQRKIVSVVDQCLHG